MSFGDHFGFEAKQLEKEPDCKGLFMRYTETVYATKDGWGQRLALKTLKRMSCPGCSQCGAILDYMKELPEEVEIGTGLGVNGIAEMGWQGEGMGHEDLYEDCHVIARPYHSPDPAVIPHPSTRPT